MEAPTSQRVFVAVNFNDNVKDELLACQDNMAEVFGKSGFPDNVFWVPRDNLHLTLLFLDEQSQESVEQICRSMDKISSQYDRVRWSANRPNVWSSRKVLAEVNVSSNFQQLQRDLTTSLLSCGIRFRHQRHWRPHISLGNISTGRSFPQRILQMIKDNSLSLTSTVETIDLLSSDLLAQPVIYRVLHRSLLRATE